MKRYQSALVICPFYASEDKNKIYCEGMTADSSLHVVFGDPKKKADYEERMCCSRYMACRLAKMLNDKYREKGK